MTTVVLVRFREERGMALITSLLVLLVVVSLSLAVVQLSSHNASQSAYDRRRDQALQTAEAALDQYLGSLPTTVGSSLCPAAGTTTVTSTPYTGYSLTVDLFDGAGTKIGCTSPAYGGTIVPATAVITADGYGGYSPQQVRRTIETKVTLVPIYGGLDRAIFGQNMLNISGNMTLRHDQLQNDADIYSNGNMDIDSSGMHIEGSVYAQGNVEFGGCVDGNIWANGYVHITTGVVGFAACDTSSGLAGYGSVTSSTSNVDLAANSFANSVCRAGTTFTASPTSKCNKLGPGPYTSPPDAISNSPQGPPPSFSMPIYGYNAADWTSNGYVVVAPPCATVTAAFLSAIVVDTVIRLSPGCALTFGNNTDVTLQANVAIINDLSFATQNQNTWSTGAGRCTGNTSKYPGDRCSLFIIRPYEAGLNCGSQPIAPNSTPGTYGISLSNQTDFGTINLIAYSQCDVTFRNNGDAHGQIVGGWVQSDNQVQMFFTPIQTPGFNPQGFEAAPSYIREIKPT